MVCFNTFTVTTAYHIGDMTASRSLCFRVQTATGCILWLHTVMRLQGGGNYESSFNDFASRQPVIMCTSHVIDEMSALFIRLQELETPTETAESDNRQMTASGAGGLDDSIFSGFSSGIFEPALPLKPATMRTASQREDDRMQLNQRLKRKISDRQLEQQYTDAVRPSKLHRMDDLLSMDCADLSMPLCSMPSPPMQPWDCSLMQSTSGSVGQTAFSHSTFGVNVMQDLSATTFNFQPRDDVTMPANERTQMPDTYLTPSCSPTTVDNSSTEDVDLFGLDDLIKSQPDDYSFFGGPQPARIVTQRKAPLVESRTNNSRWNAASLPELDLCSVASILGDPELPTPTSAGAPTISEFGLKVGSSRQQLSGGHVIIVNNPDQSVIFGKPGAMSAAANQPQPLRVMTAPATMMTAELGSCNGNGTTAVGDIDEQLICDLLLLGGDFMQNVAFNAPDTAFTSYGTDLFQPTTVNQFPCLATSTFGECVYQTLNQSPIPWSKGMLFPRI
jgi:hypothetical protein